MFEKEHTSVVITPSVAVTLDHHSPLTQARLTSVDDPYRYIYFNQLNLLLKSSLRAGRPGPAGRLQLYSAVNALLNSMHTQASAMPPLSLRPPVLSRLLARLRTSPHASAPCPPPH